MVFIQCKKYSSIVSCDFKYSTCKEYKSTMCVLSAGCEILVKAEFLNCGGSVKDRAALYLIKDAEEKGVTTYIVCI